MDEFDEETDGVSFLIETDPFMRKVRLFEAAYGGQWGYLPRRSGTAHPRKQQVAG